MTRNLRHIITHLLLGFVNVDTTICLWPWMNHLPPVWWSNFRFGFFNVSLCVSLVSWKRIFLLIFSFYSCFKHYPVLPNIFSEMLYFQILSALYSHFPQTLSLFFPISTMICFDIWNDLSHNSWWRHQMEAFSALLAICAGNSPVPGEFPTQRPVTRSFDIFFDLRPNKRLSKQWWGWWFETPVFPNFSWQ